jgi:hypothetical protein
MATISPVTLRIIDVPNSGNVSIDVGYTVSASSHDLATEQNYREVCELIGDDTPGDGTDDILQKLREEIIVFSGNTPHFTRAIQTFVPVSLLDEDRGIIALEEDEIRARVTLTPIPTSRESNLIRRGGLVINPNP